jgi:hypothetical protein
MRASVEGGFQRRLEGIATNSLPDCQRLPKRALECSYLSPLSSFSHPIPVADRLGRPVSSLHLYPQYTGKHTLRLLPENEPSLDEEHLVIRLGRP